MKAKLFTLGLAAIMALGLQAQTYTVTGKAPKGEKQIFVTHYAPPNGTVYTNDGYIVEMGEDVMAVRYPELGSFAEAYNKLAYKNLDSETLSYLNTLWENVKIN